MQALFSMRSGARAIASHSLCRLESTLNIYTGKEILRIPLPENRFFLRVLMMNLMTLFCAAILT